MYTLFPRIHERLQTGQAVALATVIGRRGSLPMASDAKLLVLADDSFEGTVGGGCLEAEVYAGAAALLRDGSARVDEYHLNEVEAETGGHVCGGTVEVFTRVLRPDDDVVRFVDTAVRLQDTDPELVLATRIDSRAPAHLLAGRDGLAAALGDTEGVRYTRAKGVLDDSGARWFVESVRPAPLLIVFGAGHCGAALGAAASAAGFRVWMLEDRPAFLQAEAMPWAERLRLVDFTALPELPLGADTSVAIVTRGHDHDLVVLRQLIGEAVNYLGMIGSRHKRELFRRILTEEGCPQDDFDRLRSPMGMDIGAETPAEIAVSVVAELVAARRKRALEDAAAQRQLSV